MRKPLLILALVAVLAASGALASFAQGKAKPPSGPAAENPYLLLGQGGYSVHELVTSCDDQVVSTESGSALPMPEDFDNNQLFRGPGGRLWLVSNHELTEPRPGEYQGDAGKCAVAEQTAGDTDSNGFGSVSRLTLAKDGVHVLRRELITTGLHDLCAGAQTPWNTFLTNEEFPFINDPQKTSGWVWEIDPRNGTQTRLTGMGYLSHEQEARVGNVWIETEDFGDARFLYKFVPDRASDLTSGKLYALVFDHSTNTGHWVGPLDPNAPEADLQTRFGIEPTPANTFVKSEGMITAATGDAVVFSESGSGSDPGRVWLLTGLHRDSVHGTVLAEGDWSHLSRPDNLLYTKRGDLFILEDNGSSLAHEPRTGGLNDIWVLPKGKTGTGNLVRFARVKGGGEPTGPELSLNGKILYLSIQDQEIEGENGHSRVLAIVKHHGNFNHPLGG